MPTDSDPGWGNIATRGQAYWHGFITGAACAGIITLLGIIVRG